MLRNRVKLASLLGLGLAALPTAASAAAWTLNAGQGDAFFTVAPSTSPEAFIGSHSLSPTYNKIESEAYVEYGITDQLTAIFAPTLDHIEIGPPTNADRTGLGYTDLGARYNFWSGNNWVFSGQATLRVPGTFDNSNPAAIGYTDFQSDVRGLVGYGFSIGPLPAFIDVEAAQRFSFGGPPDEFHGDVTFGIRPFPQWLLLAQSFSVISEGNRLPEFTSYNYSKVALSLVYDLARQWSLQAGAFTTYEERNALEERGLIFGAWYRF